MKIFILMDDEPQGGYFAGQSWPPNLSMERRSIREVREVEMPKEIWEFIINGGAPVDTMPDGSESNDSTWREWWSTGTMVWSRS